MTFCCIRPNRNAAAAADLSVVRSGRVRPPSAFFNHDDADREPSDDEDNKNNSEVFQLFRRPSGLFVGRATTSVRSLGCLSPES